MMNYSDMEKLGKDEGFANNEVTALAYDVKRDLLLIGYSDGNIDLLQNDRIIFNIPGFKTNCYKAINGFYRRASMKTRP